MVDDGKFRRALLAALVATACHTARAEQPGAARPGDATGAPANPDNDALSGPRVDEAKAGPTIVERNFDGTLKKTETRPEEAAVRRLPLSDTERSRVDGILSERAAELDEIVRANIDTLLKLQSARASGDRKAIGDATKDFTEAMRPLASKGRLAERIAAVLEPDNAARYERMLRDYYRALLNDGRKERPRGDPMDEMVPDRADAEAPARGDGAARGARVMLDVLGQEVRRSYERLAAEGQGRLEELAGRLNLTPEQQAGLREITTEFAQQAKLNPTPAQRAELFGRILSELTPEQRAKAIDLVRAR